MSTDTVPVRPTPDQLRMLRHMLGINTPNDRVPKPYRNYAAVVPGDKLMIDLEAQGLVERYASYELSQYDFYRCTARGHLAAMLSHRSIRRTKAQRVYACFLKVSDAFHDLTFREFLTSAEFAEARAQA
jgi:hypothetical protein